MTSDTLVCVPVDCPHGRSGCARVVVYAPEEWSVCSSGNVRAVAARPRVRVRRAGPCTGRCNTREQVLRNVGGAGFAHNSDGGLG